MNRASSAAIEKTEVFDRLQDIVTCALDVLSRIQKTHDLCLDRWGPSAVLGNKVVKDAFIAIVNRGGKIRLITEISKANANYCTEFMKFAEVRHLDKVLGNFSISDGLHYTASAHSEKDQPPRRLIYSTVKEIAEQHQYFFETLWDKATPADQRIGELEGKVNEKTEVVYGEQDSLNLLIEVMTKTRKEALACSSSTVPIFCMTVASAKKIIMDSQTRGVRSRQITEITKENVRYCKEFMKYVELRHMPNIQGNMLITDNHEYVATASLTPSSVAQAIYSNSRTIVEQQRLFFENLWSKAVLAEQRIAELEEGIEPEFADIITDGGKAAELILDFAKSVRKEAQLILPQPKTMDRAGKLGMWDYLIDAANNGAEIKVISPLSEVNTALATEIMAKAPRIKILSGPITTSGLFIHDEKRYLRAEDRDHNADEAADAISRVIYSNSINGVKSFKSFFETLWKQSELYEQLHAANEKLRIQDSLQKEFINIAAHELRTPVQPILGMADLLGYRVEERDGERGVWLDENELGMVIRNARRLERLSSDILDIARIESGNLHLSIAEFDLNELITPLIQEVHNEAAGKKVEVKYKPPANGTVRADKDRLAQVVWNLINNALKFTENGIVSIEAQKDDGNAPLIITITDSGKGIDPEMLPRLFTKFATKSNRGTGLGLYISKSIVDAHGGIISASNHDDGKGATFTVMIPVIN